MAPFLTQGHLRVTPGTPGHGCKADECSLNLPVVMTMWQVSVPVQGHETNIRWQTACSLLFHCCKQLEGYFPPQKTILHYGPLHLTPPFAQLPLALLPMENIKYGLVK